MLTTAAILSLTVTWLCTCSCLEQAQPLSLAQGKVELPAEKKEAEEDAVKEAEEEVRSMASAQAEFGLELFRLVAKQSPLENVVMSPLTTSVALMMLYAGAGPTTGETMSRVLRLAGLRSSEAHDSLGRLLSRLASRGHTKLAARIFAAKGVTLKKPFVDVVGARYGARPHGLLGPPREDVKAINAWVEERTEGRVTGLLDDLPLEARLVLVSAVHYRGEWEVKFDVEATKLQSFHLDETNSTHVTMMHQREYPVWVGRHPQLPCMVTTTLPYTLLHYYTTLYTTLYTTTLYTTTLYTTLYTTTLLHYTLLHYTLHYTLLHYYTIHYYTTLYTRHYYTTTLHYTLLHYTLDESNSTHVTMMHQREYPVWVGRHPKLPCMALKVPFKGNGSLVLFLPDGRSPSNLSSVVDSLTPSLISGLLEGGGLSKRSVTLVMPRMDLVVDRDLKRPLEAMGLQELFESPDLSELSTASLRVSAVIHYIIHYYTTL
ncbi:alpha-2-antiplasmin-like [Petromyzon marinus]|uniref:alpha-2-antiplasmin-like n=1 Tax=Petromyzon marinus TaxID=7757 RepID=UPI003F6F63F6